MATITKIEATVSRDSLSDIDADQYVERFEAALRAKHPTASVDVRIVEEICSSKYYVETDDDSHPTHWDEEDVRHVAETVFAEMCAEPVQQ